MGERCALVIPAAGEGRRMNSSTRKPFLTLGGRPILHLTLERFAPVSEIKQTILAVGAEDYSSRDEILAQTAALGVTDVVAGGRTRTESVAGALAVLAADVAVVLIHDAVRPFVPLGVIEGVIEGAARSGAAIAAVPVRDTVKRAAGDAVEATVPREGLYLAQTPQGFRRETIENVYRTRGPGRFTDDASLVEEAGGRVEIVESTYLNFKITTPEDLALARAVFGALCDGQLHF